MLADDLNAQLLQVTSFTLVWIKMFVITMSSFSMCVTSFTLVWIKIFKSYLTSLPIFVTSFTLVWIKMGISTELWKRAQRHELHARVD